MGTDEEWCASALARTEAQVALHRASVSSRQQAQLWRSLRDEGEASWVVPPDDRCMARAVEIGATFGVRNVDANHLAAAARLPGPGSSPTLPCPQHAPPAPPAPPVIRHRTHCLHGQTVHISIEPRDPQHTET